MEKAAGTRKAELPVGLMSSSETGLKEACESGWLLREVVYTSSTSHSPLWAAYKEIAEQNIPTVIPLVYKSEDNLHPIRRYLPWCSGGAMNLTIEVRAKQEKFNEFLSAIKRSFPRHFWK